MSLYTRNDQGEVVDVFSRRRVPPNEQAIVLAVLATMASPKPETGQMPRDASPDEAAVIEFRGS